MLLNHSKVKLYKKLGLVFVISQVLEYRQLENPNKF